MAAVGGQVIQQSHSMPSGVDHTGLPSSTPEHKKSARNVINVKIQMLDNSISVFQIQVIIIVDLFSISYYVNIKVLSFVMFLLQNFSTKPLGEFYLIKFVR